MDKALKIKKEPWVGNLHLDGFDTHLPALL